MMKLPTTIFRTSQKEPGDEANTNIALPSIMKQESLTLLVAYASLELAYKPLGIIFVSMEGEPIL